MMNTTMVDRVIYTSACVATGIIGLAIGGVLTYLSVMIGLLLWQGGLWRDLEIAGVSVLFTVVSYLVGRLILKYQPGTL